MQQGYTGRELIEAGGLDGQLSEQQLETLQRVGLLPERKRRGLGRGRGVRMEYPPEAVAQLQAVVRYRRQTKSGRRLRVALWLEGFPIEWERVQADLLEPLRRVSAGIEEWRARQIQDPDATAYQLHEAAKFVEEGAAKVRLPFARRGLARTERDMVMNALLIGAIEGQLRGVLTEAPEGGEKCTARALTTALRVPYFDDLPAWLEAGDELGLFDATRLTAALESAGPHEAERVRRGIQALVQHPFVSRLIAHSTMSFLYLATLAAVSVVLGRLADAVVRTATEPDASTAPALAG